MENYPAKILVASDGSDASAKALEHAAQLAAAVGTELHLVLVGLISPWTHPDAMSDNQLERIRKETRDRLSHERQKLEKMGVSEVHAHERLGKVGTEIVRLSEEIDVGTIVIANRGMGSLKRMLLGSDAEDVVRHASCAVVVVRG